MFQAKVRIKDLKIGTMVYVSLHYSDFKRMWEATSLKVEMHKPAGYEVSISSTFYKRLFLYKCFAQLISTYILALKFFGQNNIGAKGMGKMLMKLTTGGHQSVIGFFTRTKTSDRGCC